MRVLLYAPAMYPKVDGVALRTRHHVRNLLELGHQVLILTPIHGASDIFEGAQVVKLPAFVPSGYPESMISYPLPIVTLSRIFNQFAPDIVHFIGPDFIFIPMVLICKYYNVPIIGSYHFYVQAFLERLPAFQRSLLFWLGWIEYSYNFSDCVITPSRPMQQILHSKRMRCDDVWPPAVDTDVFNPRFKSQAMREKLTWGHPDQPLILYVGRVAKEKSMEIMLNILEAHPQCYLAIVGAGPDMDKWLVHHSAERHIFCSNAHWSGEALSQAYASADVFVIPSAFETLGNVVLESLASGVPVVGCNAGGIPHLLENNTNGFLFEPNDAASLCDAVGKLINDPRLRQTLGDNGMHHVANLSWRASSEYVEDIYKRVITKHGRRVPGVNAPFEPVADKGPIFVDPQLSYNAGTTYFVSALPYLICVFFALAMLFYSALGRGIFAL